jgi:hypothetical protein
METLIDRKPNNRPFGMAAAILWLRAQLPKGGQHAQRRQLLGWDEERRLQHACAVFEMTLVASFLILVGLTISAAFLR